MLFEADVGNVSDRARDLEAPNDTENSFNRVKSSGCHSPLLNIIIILYAEFLLLVFSHETGSDGLDYKLPLLPQE